MDDLHAQIAKIEGEIERLSSSAETCRKIDLLARVIMIIAGVWLAATIFGLIWSDVIAMLASISGLILGIVLYGSNRRTWNDTANRLAALDAHRTSLIDAVDPMTVEDTRRTARRLQ